MVTTQQNINIETFLTQNIKADDFAENQNVLELCNHPKELTKKAYNGYNGVSGYCGIHAPAYLTIDLGRERQVGLIQLLLMDLVEDMNHGKKERLYYFRILTAEDYTRTATDKDKIKWSVLYDSQHCGYRNWQFIHVTKGIKARFIRIHCIHNNKNNGFHVVRLRVYSDVVADAVNYDEIHRYLHKPEVQYRNTVIACDRDNLSQIIHIEPQMIETEIGDGFPLSKRIYDTTNLIKQIVDEDNHKADFLQFNFEDRFLSGINSTITAELEGNRVEGNKHLVNIELSKIHTILTSMADDVAVVEQHGNGMERVLLDPINLTLDKGNKTDILLTILSIVFMIIPCIIYFFPNLIKI